MGIGKKISISLLLLWLSAPIVGAAEGDTSSKDAIKNGLLGESIPKKNTILDDSTSPADFDLDTVASFVDTSITDLLMVISIGVFLYIGIRIAVARGNPEEFKKAMIHFVYAIVGIFIVFVAWALVTLVAGLNVG